MSCLSACEDQVNSFTSISQAYPTNRERFSKSKHFCKIFLRLNSTCNSNKERFFTGAYPNVCDDILQVNTLFDDEIICQENQLWPSKKLHDLNATLADRLKKSIFKYAQENVMIVKVFMKDITVTSYTKDEKISTISFLANTGGLLGLCIGLSIVTFFEFIFHILSASLKFFRIL